MKDALFKGEIKQYGKALLILSSLWIVFKSIEYGFHLLANK